jgi:hypothetical protein
MTSVIFSDQTISLEKIIDKNIDNLTFKEIISLVFYAVSTVANDITEPDHSAWKNIYEEFEKELHEQNKHKWPNMSIIKNDYSKRIDIFSTGATFITSKNFLMLLFRLLYVENYKRPYIYKSYKYHKMLSHKMKISNNTSVKKLSMIELFKYLKTCLNYYIKIYNDDMNFEYQLCKSILCHLE